MQNIKYQKMVFKEKLHLWKFWIKYHAKYKAPKQVVLLVDLVLLSGLNIATLLYSVF